MTSYHLRFYDSLQKNRCTETEFWMSSKKQAQLLPYLRALEPSAPAVKNMHWLPNPDNTDAVLGDIKKRLEQYAQAEPCSFPVAMIEVHSETGGLCKCLYRLMPGKAWRYLGCEHVTFAPSFRIKSHTCQAGNVLNCRRLSLEKWDRQTAVASDSLSLKLSSKSTVPTSQKVVPVMAMIIAAMVVMCRAQEF